MGERVRRDTPRKPLTDIAIFYPRWKFASPISSQNKKKREKDIENSLAINQDETRTCPFFQDYDDEIENGRGRRHSSPGGSRGNPRDYGHHLHPDNLVSPPAQIRSSDTALWDTLPVFSPMPLKSSDRVWKWQNALTRNSFDADLDLNKLIFITKWNSARAFDEKDLNSSLRDKFRREWISIFSNLY